MLDAHAEGIRLLELRYAPSFASLNHNFAYGDVLSAIQEGVRSGQEQLGGEVEIGVGLLCIGVGAMGSEEMRKTTDFFLEHQDAFCGFDMAGAETNVLQHAECFQRVRDAGGRIACHASAMLANEHCDANKMNRNHHRQCDDVITHPLLLVA